MNITILIIYMIISGLIQAIGMLADKWNWLGLKTAEIPYFNSIINWLTLICFLAGIFHQVMVEIKNYNLSLFVVPKYINVSPNYGKISLIKIVNNQDFPIYHIDLKTTVESGDLSLDDVKLEPKDESDIGGINFIPYIFGLGIITNEGKRENHNYIYDIDAHSSKEFILKINADKTHKKSKVMFQIIRTAKEPADIVILDPYQYCQSDRHDFETYHKTSKKMLENKRYKEALLCCEKALIKNPSSAKAHSNKGVAHLFLNEIDRATTEFKSAIDSDPKIFSPYMNLAIVFIKLEKFEEAVKLLKIATDLNDEKQPEAFILWGQCLVLQGDNKGAIEKFKRAIELDPECGTAYFRWGMILKKEGYFEKAISKLKKSTEYEHFFKLLSYGMWGACLEELGENQEAINKYKVIIEIAPNSNEAKKARNSIEAVEKKLRDYDAK